MPRYDTILLLFMAVQVRLKGEAGPRLARIGTLAPGTPQAIELGMTSFAWSTQICAWGPNEAGCTFRRLCLDPALGTHRLE